MRAACAKIRYNHIICMMNVTPSTENRQPEDIMKVGTYKIKTIKSSVAACLNTKSYNNNCYEAFDIQKHMHFEESKLGKIRNWIISQYYDIYWYEML